MSPELVSKMSGISKTTLTPTKPRLTPTELPNYSSYFKRSLSALSGGDEKKSSELIEELLSEPLDVRRLVEDLEKKSQTGDFEGQMRKARRRLMMSLIAKDLTGRATLSEVTSAISDFAQAVVTKTVAHHAKELAKRFGVPHSPLGVPQDLLVVGMGKLGGHELNVSSDIDLIFLYDEDGECRSTEEFPNPRKQISNREFFEKLAKKIIPAISNITGDGYVFRVDMRLRPNGDSGPIVCSSEMLEEYLITQGRDWERFAWMKGRIVSGPVFTTPEQFKTQDANLYSLVRPFVYRKYLDFSAISALTDLHAKIRASTQIKASSSMTKGQNVKLGRGGIREIEFIAQTFQIIRGGRNPRLRERRTLKALDLLAEQGVLEKAKTERLKDIYVFLRNTEHALQYREDQQTQLLPDDVEIQEQVAKMLGFERREFLSRLSESTEFVAEQFDAIFQTKNEEVNDGWPVGWEVLDEAVKERLRNLFKERGYQNPDQIIDGLISITRQGLYKAVNSTTRQKLRSLLKFVIDNVDSYGDWTESSLPKEEAVLRYIRFLEVITGRPTYLSLLLQYPQAAKRVGRLLASSKWAADYLIRHPILLDELLDERNDTIDDFTPVDYNSYKEKTQELLDATDPKDVETRMNIVREAHHGALFKLLLADTAGRLTVERLADQLSALADATLEIAISEAWKTVPGRFTDIEFPKFCVIAYGKLGGKELGYASDLDLIFLFEDDHADSEKIYGRFARRLMSWLSAPTSSGLLFDVDMRLRPNGESGMLVCTMDAYKKYERNEDGTGAWLWEHQALSRGRFAAGDPELGYKFEEIRKEILSLERDPASTAKEILAMRQRMHDGHVNNTKLFDIKHDAGGMVDIEFIVQYLILVNSHKHPELVNNFGNILLLSMAADAGLINKELAEAVASAYRNYRKFQHEYKLNHPETHAVRVDPAMFAKEAAQVRQLWGDVFAQFEVTSQ